MTAALKTMTFAAVHFTVAFTVAYVLTGSVAISSALALLEPACNTVAYYFHERAWSRWGKRVAEDDSAGHRGLTSLVAS
ncbi:MAG: DUF2061 domain-containing protein [Pseudomonadota bacterium]